MKTYTVKQLKELLRKHKANSSSCIAYSRLNKDDLLLHARKFGLIADPGTPSRNVKSSFFNFLVKMENEVESFDAKTPAAKKKKASLQRRLERVMNMEVPAKEASGFMNRLNKTFEQMKVLNLHW